MNLIKELENHGKSYYLIIGSALIGLIGFVHYLVGYEFSFSLFYVIPISFVGWFTSRRYGIAASIISAVVWLSVDIISDHTYSSALVPIWNAFIRLSFFVIITVLLSIIKNLSIRERELSRTDTLTEAANTRYFREFLQMEIDRIQRYEKPFSLAYIDLDNFKSMNDQFGHSTGDDILRAVVSTTRKNLRKTDMVARLGGDEFGLLLPETNQETARVVLMKVLQILKEEMREKAWSITFSIGVVTCLCKPNTTDELITMADSLMYSVKHDGKDGIRFSTYTG